MLDFSAARVVSLIRFLRGVEPTSIPTEVPHSVADIHFLEKDLSNSTYKATVFSDEAGLVVKWRLIDPFLMAFSWALVCLFVLFAACLAFGLILFLPNNIATGVIGMPIVLVFSRMIVLMWRISPKAVYRRLV